jgi:hypothetical protein
MMQNAIKFKEVGASWHVVVGEGFGFGISYDVTQEAPLFYLHAKRHQIEMRSLLLAGMLS